MMPWSWIRNTRYLGWAISLAAVLTKYTAGLYLGMWIVLMSYMLSFNKIEQINQLLAPDSDGSKNEEGK